MDDDTEIVRTKVVIPPEDTRTQISGDLGAIRERLKQANAGITDAAGLAAGVRTAKGARKAQAGIDGAVNEAATALKSARDLENDLIRRAVIDDNRVDILMTEVLDMEVASIHARIVDFQNAQIASGRNKGVILCMRNGGKTTAGTIARAIWYIIKDRNVRILLSSKTHKNAIDMLSEIKSHLKNNERLREIFGTFVADDTVWNETEVNVVGRTLAAKEKTIMTVGVDGAIASRHFDVIFGDDLVDEGNTQTKLRRDKAAKFYYTTLDPCLNPGGQMWVVGTRYHPDDLYGRLMGTDDNPGEFHEDVLHIRGLEDEGKAAQRSCWPDRFSVDDLLLKRSNMGSIIFGAQIQNEIDAMRGEVFQYNWFKDCEYRTTPATTAGGELSGGFYLPDKDKFVPWGDLTIYHGVDPAIAQFSTSDYFAHARVAVTPDGDIVVFGVKKDRISFGEQKKLIEELHKKDSPRRVGIEKNGYQKALLDDLKADRKYRHVRAVGILTNKSKDARAHKLSAYFEAGRVYFGPGLDWVKGELLPVPNGEHDDVFDAIDLAISLAVGSARVKKDRRNEPGLITPFSRKRGNQNNTATG